MTPRPDTLHAILTFITLAIPIICGATALYAEIVTQEVCTRLGRAWIEARQADLEHLP